jgi:hypothetical protein
MAWFEIRLKTIFPNLRPRCATRKPNATQRNAPNQFVSRNRVLALQIFRDCLRSQLWWRDLRDDILAPCQ